MKKLVALMLFLSSVAWAANPSFNSFDTRHFYTNASGWPLAINSFGLTNRNEIYCVTNGNDDTADGTVFRPYQTIFNALAACGPNYHLILGPGVFDVSTNGLLWPPANATNLTISGQGMLATRVYSTNYATGASLNMFVTRNGLTLEDMAIESNPADDGNGSTTTFPILVYGSTNVTVRRVYIKGESDGIAVLIGSVNANRPTVNVYDSIFDTTWDSVLMSVNAAPLGTVTNSVISIYNTHFLLTRAPRMGQWKSALHAAGGSIRMFGGSITISNQTNIFAAFNNGTGGHSKNELNGVRMDVHGTGVLGNWNNFDGAGDPKLMLLNGCYNTDGSPLQGVTGQYTGGIVTNNATATFFQQATNAPTGDSIYTSGGTVNYWSSNLKVASGVFSNGASLGGSLIVSNTAAAGQPYVLAQTNGTLTVSSNLNVAGTVNLTNGIGSYVGGTIGSLNSAGWTNTTGTNHMVYFMYGGNVTIKLFPENVAIFPNTPPVGSQPASVMLKPGQGIQTINGGGGTISGMNAFPF